MSRSKPFGPILRNSILAFVMVVIFAMIPLRIGRGMAQQSAPLDEVSPTPSPILLGGGGDGLPEGQRIVEPYSAAMGPDMAIEAAPTFSYYRLIGPAFNIRVSTTIYNYTGNGCIYTSSGSDNRFVAPLLLPDNSTIKFLRLYYNDTSVPIDISAWITRYQPGVMTEDVTTVDSSGSSGYGTTLSPEVTHTVDLTNWAYTINIAPNSFGPATSFCGVRVAYYAPSIWLTALPVISRNSP